MFNFFIPNTKGLTMNVKRNMLIALFVAAAVNPVVAEDAKPEVTPAPTPAPTTATVTPPANPAPVVENTPASAPTVTPPAPAADSAAAPATPATPAAPATEAKKDESNFISNAASTTWNGVKGIAAFFVQADKGWYVEEASMKDGKAELDKDGKAVMVIAKAATLQAYVLRAALAFSAYKAVAFAYDNLFAQSEEEDEDNN